jgi:hypothetical protein
MAITDIDISVDNKLSSDLEQRIKALKRLEQLSLKSLREPPQLEEPNQEQKHFVNRKMRASEGSWEAYNNGV